MQVYVSIMLKYSTVVSCVWLRIFEYRRKFRRRCKCSEPQLRKTFSTANHNSGSPNIHWNTKSLAKYSNLKSEANFNMLSHTYIYLLHKKIHKNISPKLKQSMIMCIPCLRNKMLGDSINRIHIRKNREERFCW